MRLGGWIRLGLVATALWIAFLVAEISYQLWTTPVPTFLVTLNAGHTLAYPRVGHIALALFAVPATLWLLVLAGVVTFRWVVAGFMRS